MVGLKHRSNIAQYTDVGFTAAKANSHKAMAHVLQHVLSRHPHGHVAAAPQGLQGTLKQPLPVGPIQEPLHFQHPSPYHACLPATDPAAADATESLGSTRPPKHAPQVAPMWPPSHALINTWHDPNCLHTSRGLHVLIFDARILISAQATIRQSCDYRRQHT